MKFSQGSRSEWTAGRQGRGRRFCAFSIVEQGGTAWPPCSARCQGQARPHWVMATSAMAEGHSERGLALAPVMGPSANPIKSGRCAVQDLTSHFSILSADTLGLSHAAASHHRVLVQYDGVVWMQLCAHVWLFIGPLFPTCRVFLSTSSSHLALLRSQTTSKV